MARDPRRRAERLRSLAASPSMQALLRDGGTPLPDDVARWLAQRALLEGLPFNNLVADARMLPRESIRFFFIDRNWIDALLDGALSVAHLDEAQGAVVRALRGAAGRRATAVASVHRRRHRALRRGDTPPAAAAADDTSETPLWTGLLLRSAAVTNWPGLAVTAYAGGAGTDPLDLLRLERLSPSVLIALFDGVGARFEIAMPAQALHFGFTDDPIRPGTYRVGLRGLGGAIPVGQSIGEFADVPFRDDPAGRRVVDVRALHRNMVQGIDAAYQRQRAPAPPLNPGAFAIELIRGAERQAFLHRLPNADAVREPARPLPPAPQTLRQLIEDLRRGR